LAKGLYEPLKVLRTRKAIALTERGSLSIYQYLKVKEDKEVQEDIAS
jgi:hypothetical protein